ncbi:MAG: VWA domain-containing protein, partial [Candidatus Latescibacterota bacterium]
LDVSASGLFGTHSKTKIDTAAEICALLAFSAIQNNDKVGAIIFSDDVEEYVPPDKGRRHVLHVVRNVLYHTPKGRGTNLAGALEYLLKVIKRRAIVFVLSDFMAPDFSSSLAVAANKHDVVAIKISDSKEINPGASGLVRLWDQERGEERLIDLSGKAARRRFDGLRGTRELELESMFKRYNVDWVDVDTVSDYVKPLNVFFRARAKRK